KAVCGFIPAAPLGVQPLHSLVAGEPDRQFDHARSLGQLREGTFGDRSGDGFGGQFIPAGATVPLRIGVEDDIAHPAPKSLFVVPPSSASTMRPTSGWRTTSAAVK